MQTIFRAGLYQGEVAIVTGGGSGIGLAIAARLLFLGAHVAICGRDSARLAHAVALLAEKAPSTTGEEDADRIFSATCDIREPGQVVSFVNAVVARFGDVSVLVNNAGGQFPSAAENISPKGWDAVIRNNLNGTFYMTREVATQC